MAHGADFEQFSCLRLHSLRRIDDHDCGVRRHQSPVSILGEILMPRSIQDVDAESLVVELQHRDVTEIPLSFSISIQSDTACFAVAFPLTEPAWLIAPP